VTPERSGADAPSELWQHGAGIVRHQRAAARPNLMLAGDGWRSGPLVALDAHATIEPDALDPGALLVALDRRLARRRSEAAPGGTGTAVLLGYEALGPLPPRSDPCHWPRAIVLEVDAALRRGAAGPVLALRPGVDRDEVWDRIEHMPAPEAAAPAAASGRPRTSLPRDAYLRAVARVRQHIAAGDVYQANLCQQFEVAYRGDPFETWLDLVRTSPAPHSAWIEAAGIAVASLSPETFLASVAGGGIETLPIKGTRPRGATLDADRDAAEELLGSPKDRAELMIIVDLERNDLSRVCVAGTVRVPEPLSLRSFPAVHHLVARVRGTLRAGVAPSDLLRATFPGGSISGAPKRRAIEILRELEPVPRSFFTGSLLWFDDDGTLDASLLIRSLLIAPDRARLGAGGGIVSDSDPEEEWRESNHKARAWARALGFDPEEAV
jgi:anthranilate/para-aminobenzoate synthase component I